MVYRGLDSNMGINGHSISGTAITLKCTSWPQQRPHLPGGEVRATGITDHYREMTSTSFAMLANSLRAKQRPAIVAVSGASWTPDMPQ
jgi:hypothetical protein